MLSLTWLEELNVDVSDVMRQVHTLGYRLGLDLLGFLCRYLCVAMWWEVSWAERTFRNPLAS